MTLKRLGTVLRALRDDRGLTLATVAKRAKVTVPYLSQLENGTRNKPSFAVLNRLAKALGVEVKDLL